MRVLHFLGGNLFGGIEAFLVTLARQREQSPDMDPQFAFCFDGRVHDEIKASGAPSALMGPVRLSRPWTLRQARSRARELIVTARPDVVLCHAPWAHVVFAPVARRERVPLAFFLHDLADGRHWLERWASRTAPDLVITNSGFTAGYSRLLFRAPEPVVCHYPVPAPPPVSAEDRAHLRRELGVSPEQVVIIQTSRMQAWKGQAHHLHALSALRDDPRWLSVQVGGPQRADEEPYFESLKRLAHELGIGSRVRFIGQRSDVQQLLAAADVHLQPNDGPEPFGIAFIEAMHAALPVVTFRKGAAAELVTPACGVLADNPSELVAGLREVLGSRDLRKRLGDGGRTRAAELCAPERQVPKLAALLRKISRA